MEELGIIDVDDEAAATVDDELPAALEVLAEEEVGAIELEDDEEVLEDAAAVELDDIDEEDDDPT